MPTQEFRKKYFNRKAKGCHRYKQELSKDFLLHEAPKYNNKVELAIALGTTDSTIRARERQFDFQLAPLFSGVRHNHKITKIEYDVGTTDVYDMTVDKYHNFALSSGVFVHNCADSLAGAVYNCLKHNMRTVNWA